MSAGHVDSVWSSYVLILSSKPILCVNDNSQMEVNKGQGAAEFRTCIKPYLLQLLGNAHACVNSLSALGVFCLIVFQEVASGELCGNEARQRWIWNNIIRTTPVLPQHHCLQQLEPQLSTQWEHQHVSVHCKVNEKETSPNTCSVQESSHGSTQCSMNTCLKRFFWYTKKAINIFFKIFYYYSANYFAVHHLLIWSAKYQETEGNLHQKLRSQGSLFCLKLKDSLFLLKTTVKTSKYSIEEDKTREFKTEYNYPVIT